MMKIETLLEKIEKMRLQSKNLILPEQMNEKIILEKRRHSIEQISKAIDMIGTKAAREAVRYNSTVKHVLVRTAKYDLPKKDGYKEVYLPVVIIDDEPQQMLIRDPNIITWLDNEEVRIAYFDEFKERGRILLEATQIGVIDDHLSKPTYEILHEINGKYGKLLEKLEIDPLKGRTYSHFNNLIIKAAKGEISPDNYWLKRIFL